MFRLKKHKIKTFEVNKLALSTLSSEDNKRISSDEMSSLAMGH